MSLWTDRVLPRLVDRALGSPEVARERAAACAPLRGRVLELGFGSGLNVPWYPAAVTSVDAVEPADVAWELSAPRRLDAVVPITRTGLDGQRLAASDSSYDTVLSTFTLCTIPDLSRALAEVCRVLRPGGSLCFLEHGLSTDVRVAAWQRRLEPMQRRVAGGCHLTRDLPMVLTSAGFVVGPLERHYLPGPTVNRPFTALVRGVASSARS